MEQRPRPRVLGFAAAAGTAGSSDQPVDFGFGGAGGQAGHGGAGGRACGGGVGSSQATSPSPPGAVRPPLRRPGQSYLSGAPTLDDLLRLLGGGSSTDDCQRFGQRLRVGSRGEAERCVRAFRWRVHERQLGGRRATRGDRRDSTGPVAAVAVFLLPEPRRPAFPDRPWPQHKPRCAESKRRGAQRTSAGPP